MTPSKLPKHTAASEWTYRPVSVVEVELGAIDVDDQFLL